MPFLYVVNPFSNGLLTIRYSVTAGEAKKPRRDLPPVTRFMYLAPLGFYFLVSILVGMNINFMNPSLYHPWEKPAADAPKISHSPIIIILSRTSVKVLPK